MSNNTKFPSVAYFCMEYALDSNMKTYAGGLGILAGDYMKGAKDYGFPITGIGIKWKQGYTDQYVDKESGKPYDSYRNYTYEFLEDTGVTVDVEICSRNVKIKVWRCRKYGVENLYLLDTDIEENDGAARWLCGQLYGWFGEERVAQEIILGIGGIRALRALNITPEVYHFNEGHALLAGFELMREKIQMGASFEDALERTRQEIVFTTHTPVIQGNESHSIDRLLYMGANCGLNKKQLKYLGGSPFNMTVGALRLSRRTNAVAALHADTANNMWKKVDRRSEIIGITNAIHIPTWVDEEMPKLAQNYEGKDEQIQALWQRHMENKRRLIEFVRERTGAELKQDVLLIGFSRRTVPYKRSNLIFRDEKFIRPLLENGKLQIVFSGKAHPLDDTGKGIVSNLVEMMHKYPNSVVFLENYDMTIGAMLTRGSDIWLNNPRRPMEASGTSGMKAAMNGVLNVSILDGWWPEACIHGENGWQFGDGFESKNEDKLDRHDFNALKKLLNGEVLPTYYGNRAKWVDMMAKSINTTVGQFGVLRMLEEYYQEMYKKRG